VCVCGAFCGAGGGGNISAASQSSVLLSGLELGHIYGVIYGV